MNSDNNSILDLDSSDDSHNLFNFNQLLDSSGLAEDQRRYAEMNRGTIILDPNEL
jgi:hypothetical protein